MFVQGRKVLERDFMAQGGARKPGFRLKWMDVNRRT